MTTTKQQAAKKSSTTKKQAATKKEPRTITSSTPIYMRTLIDVATGWYAEPGEATEADLDGLVDHLVTLGGNE